MDITENWNIVKALFREAFKTSFHYAIATVSDNGEPHITPIGSLILSKPGKGFYFEEFSKTLPLHFKTNQQVCVLAVNSGRWFWFKSLLKGRFNNPPAVRLYGTVGERREASATEIALWQKRVKAVKFTKGHTMMWAGMKTVRDIEFHKIIPVTIGAITQDAWQTH